MKRHINLSSLSKATQAMIRAELAAPTSFTDFIDSIREYLIRGEYDEAVELIRARKALPITPSEKSLKTKRAREFATQSMLDIFQKDGIEGVKKEMARTGFKLRDRSDRTARYAAQLLHDKLLATLSSDAVNRADLANIKWLASQDALKLPRYREDYTGSQLDAWLKALQSVEHAPVDTVNYAVSLCVSLNKFDVAEELILQRKESHPPSFGWAVTTILELMLEGAPSSEQIVKLMTLPNLKGIFEGAQTVRTLTDSKNATKAKEVLNLLEL